MSEGGNSLDESIGLITAANEVVNDPSSVGTALKTLTLRLRGSKTELEEMGEDVTDMATTTSQLQAKLLALTGGQVNIMLDENTFKNSTQILREMAEAWEDMTDIQRASALELMGGKRQANVLSALIQNFDTVEKVIETSANSAGSALEENERYLDSIQGKIDQFNNAMQAMWSNILDSDVVKSFVEWGTKIIKSLDTVQGKFLALAKVLAIFMAYKKVNPLDWIAKIGDVTNTIKTDGLKNYIMSLFQVSAAQKAVTADTLVSTIAQQQNDVATQQQIISKLGLTNVTGALTAAQKLQAAQELVTLFNGGMISKDLATRMAAMLGYKFSVDATNNATVALDTTTKSFMASNPVGWILAIVSVVVVLVTLLSKIPSKLEKLEEKMSELNSEISSLESEIDSLNSELETTQERMEELLAMPSLSFTEQEELKNLQLQTAELERQVELQEILLKTKEKERAETAKEWISNAWDGEGLDKKYAKSENGHITEDKLYTVGRSGKEVLDEALPQYASARESTDYLEDVYAAAQKELSANGKLSFETFKSVVDAIPDVGDNPEAYYDQKFRYSDEELVNQLKNDIIDPRRSGLEHVEDGIEMVLADMSKTIEDNELSYSMGDEDVNKFLDEYFAYSLAYQQAQGAYVKSSAISSMFDATSTKEMQNFSKTLQEIADSDLTDEEKNAKILEQLDGIDGVIGDGVNKIEGKTDAYNRLYLAMETVSVTAQDIADYFVLESGSFNSNTIEGIANQYQHMTSVMDALKNMSNNKFTFNGVEYNWDEFFSQDDQGKFEAKAVKFSEILNGMDEKSRETFINIVESAANSAGDLSKIDWDQAIAKLDFSGLDRTFELLNNEFEGLNNEMFAGAADDINGLIDTVSELQAALEDVASTMDLVHTAQNQVNSSGRISTKTALELMQTTEDWDKILEITNGTIKLRDGAEQHLVQTELTAIKTQLHYAWTTAQARYETALAAQGEIDYANNSGIVMTAESIKAEAIGRVSAVVVALGAAMDKLMAGEWGSVFSTFGETYQTATATVVQDAQQYTTDLATLQQNADSAKKMYDAFSSVDTTEEFKNNYDFDETPGDKYGNDEDSKTDEKMDAFQREMDYWENRIGANQARYEQLQNEIDLLETKGQKVDESYFLEQIDLENKRFDLLDSQKKAAEEFLATLTEGSEEWWDVANTLNDIEGELDDVTASIVDLQDAIAEIDTYKFEEFNTRLDDITSKLSTVRDLIAPDGEEDWFDEEGNWTEDGVAVLGTYIQELETYKQGLAEAEAAYANYVNEYVGNEEYYAKLGIHSEQELYDKRQELIEQQYDYAQSISDTEQSVVDMYESNIDAVEEYTETLVNNYNDYIDSVKEALSAERDLYDFKKKVKNQTKEIAAIERRIASLSGSTNASDIAERRRLEADLYGAREELDDTYYDHAKTTQQEALDNEAAAYEETMNRFVEGLRTGLDQATTNMDEFLMGVTSMVTLNADTVLQKYQETELPLGDAITNPWEEAKASVAEYSGDALDLMNKWTQGGFFTTFPETVKGSLTSPWSAGSTAANTFKSSVSTVMSNVVSNISTNVKTASGELSKLYQQIKDTEARAASANVTPSGGNSGGGSGGGGYNPTPAPKEVAATAYLPTSKGLFSATVSANTTAQAQTGATNAVIQKAYNAFKSSTDELVLEKFEKQWRKNVTFVKPSGGGTVSSGLTNRVSTSNKRQNMMYAKGTTGTTRDQWAITDEPRFGDELVLVPGKDGNLSFMRKGTGVVPADMTQKLFELAQIPTSDLMNKNLTAIVPNITKNDFKNEFNFKSLVHVDTVDSDTLPKLEKMVDKKIDDFSKALNYSLKKFAR